MWGKLFGVAGMLLAVNAWAGDGGVMVDKVSMRETVEGQNSATVQLNLSVTKPTRLLSVSSPVAEAGEIQDVVMRRGKLQTATVDSMNIAAHSTVIFGARGIYLTLVGLKQQLVAGDRVPITLVVEVAGKPYTINTEAQVKALELSYQHYNNPDVKDHR